MEKTNSGGHSIEKELFIKATPQRVFQALTEQAELERWFLVKAELDLRPGGAISFEWDRYYTLRDNGWNIHLEHLVAWLETGTCPSPGPIKRPS